MNQRILADLFAVERPDAVLEEVCAFLERDSIRFDAGLVRGLYRSCLSLYWGRFPGYRACSTAYHDFAHAAEVFLAMARLMHGAVLQQQHFSRQQVHAALAAAIFHDSGYILSLEEPAASGAVHRDSHERRSIEFIGRHGSRLGLTEAEIAAGQSLIQCTVMRHEVSSAAFESAGTELLGRMLAVSDLVAQLSEQTYLEKLTLLHLEDAASGSPQFAGELDAIRKAVEFYHVAFRRIETTLPDWHRCSRRHFAAAWGQSRNLYQEAIARQKRRLEVILAMPGDDPRPHLRRRGCLDKTRSVYTSTGEHEGLHRLP